MISDITQFLPIYTDIDSDNFYIDIFKKKEFYDERLDEIEEVQKSGDLLKAQIIISRFLSSYTPYNTLLLNHAVGTGKTCASIGAIEKIKNEDSTFTGALIFARGKTLLENFKNELIFHCTPGQYIPENYVELTHGQQVSRQSKSVGIYYKFYTFETFAKDIISFTDEYIIETFSNKIIVIDEVHNIRLQDRKKKITVNNIYNNFHHFLHIVKNCKILLMSGTPIKDSIDEIASIMNLILPLNDQLPVGKLFISEFFIYKDDIYTIKPDKLSKLKNVFKGRVSYLESIRSNVEIEYVGEILGTLNHFKVYKNIMSNFQTNVYTEAYKKDHQKKEEEEEEEEEDGTKDIKYPELDIVTSDKIIDKDGMRVEDISGRFDTNSRQASLFVFPDGTYGKVGFKNNNYIKSSVNKISFHDTSKKTNNFTLGSELRKALNGNNNEVKINKLEKFSSKYSSVIKNILKANDERKSSFVYCEYVEGSGGILFSLILELFGFKKYSGSEDLKSPLNISKRYSIINNKTTYPTEIKNILKRFNDPNNMHGEFISVIIGSKVISEGITLKNVQEEHILTSHWNYSETSQAIARGYRFNSHKDLIRAGIKPVLHIYQYVSIPNNNNSYSIDLRLYEISEIKDININGISKIIKESAFDCALNYKRNYIKGYDNQRECNYTKCEYLCDGVPEIYYLKDVVKPKLDYSSYQTYYNTSTIDELIEKFREKFRQIFKIKLQYIIEEFDTYTEFDILTTIRIIINDNIQLHNKYGISSYLREENNIFFLVDSLSNKNTYFSNYYNKNPLLELETSYMSILNIIYQKELPILIKKLFSSNTDTEISEILSSFHLELQESILEGSLIAKEKGLKESVFQRDKILDYFEHVYEKIDNTWISSLLYIEKDILRCFNIEKLDKVKIEDLWEDCNDLTRESFIEGKHTKINVLKQNEYFGKFNNKNFCIIKSNFAVDKRNENTGKVCKTWDKPILIYIIINILKIPLTIIDECKWKSVQNDLSKINNAKDILIEKFLLTNKYVRICNYNDTDSPPIWEMRKYTYTELDGFSYVDLKTMLYLCKLTKEQNCELIKQWFGKQDPSLLFYDEGCGKK